MPSELDAIEDIAEDVQRGKRAEAMPVLPSRATSSEVASQTHHDCGKHQLMSVGLIFDSQVGCYGSLLRHRVFLSVCQRPCPVLYWLIWFLTR
jgi:hypothetical protein